MKIGGKRSSWQVRLPPSRSGVSARFRPRLDPQRQRSTESRRVLHERPDAHVLDLPGLQLRHIRLTDAEGPRNLSLGEPAFVAKCGKLLLDLHLVDDLFDFPAKYRGFDSPAPPFMCGSSIP